MNPIHSWTAFLRDLHGISAVPLLVGGAALALFGWRLWRLCVGVSFGLIGILATAWLWPEETARHPWFYIPAGGLLLGLAACCVTQYAIAVLGGVIVAGVMYVSFTTLGMYGPMLWSMVAVSFLAGTAFAFLSRQTVVILVTAFLGACLLVSAGAAVLMDTPSLHGTLKSLSSSYKIVVPFFLLVPTVMSFFYQSAELHRGSMRI